MAAIEPGKSEVAEGLIGETMHRCSRLVAELQAQGIHADYGYSSETGTVAVTIQVHAPAACRAIECPIHAVH